MYWKNMKLSGFSIRLINKPDNKDKSTWVFKVYRKSVDEIVDVKQPIRKVAGRTYGYGRTKKVHNKAIGVNYTVTGLDDIYVITQLMSGGEPYKELGNPGIGSRVVTAPCLNHGFQDLIREQVIKNQVKEEDPVYKDLKTLFENQGNLPRYSVYQTNWNSRVKEKILVDEVSPLIVLGFAQHSFGKKRFNCAKVYDFKHVGSKASFLYIPLEFLYVCPLYARNNIVRKYLKNYPVS